MASILVAGGAGFVGSHLVDRLIELGHEVMIADNFSSGSSMNIHPEARVLDCEISEKCLRKEMKRFRPQYVYCLTAQKCSEHVLSGLEGVVSMLDYQPLKGLENLLKISTEVSIKKFIMASSHSVYGKPKYLGIDECHPLHPLTIQGKLQLQQEYKVREWAQRTGMQYVILRYANVFGSRQQRSCITHLFQEIFDCMDSQLPIIVEDDGLLKRDYIYIADAVEAAIKAMDYGINDVINIGSGIPVTSHQVIRAVEICTARQMQVESIPLVYNHVDQIYYDIQKSKSVLGWHPEYTLHQGISEMVKKKFTEETG